MAEQAAEGRQVMLQRVYLKDASLEVPQAPKIFTRNWQPKVDVQVGTTLAALGNDTHQVLLSVTVTAKLEDDVAFLVEVHQAAIFLIKGFDKPEEKQAILAGYCPGILFPFAREAVANLVQRAGFPQILLQPINFESVYSEYAARQKQAVAEAAVGATRPQ